jgi:hypothetical protein
MRPSKARSELSVGLACNLRWVTYEGAVHSRPARHTPEVEAGCGKAARPVLCGGRIAICVPTAIVSTSEMIGKRGRHVVCDYVAVGNGENGGSRLDHQAITSYESSRAVYLERENARLQRLVAELLVKNEQLRRLYLASSTVSD